MPRSWRFGVGLLIVATAATLCTSSAIGADVTSTFKVAAGMWGVSTNWTNTPALGGFPNNGNAGVATYDAVVPSGTVTLDTNIVIQKFTQTSGTVTGLFNLTANDLHSWTSGILSGSGTNFDLGGLAVTGTVTLSARRLESAVSGSLTGGSLHLGTGAVLTNDPGATFNFLDDSSIFNDGGSPVFLNMGTIDKTGAGNGISGVGVGVSRIDAPLYNHSTVHATTGTVEIHGGGVTGSSLNVAAGARILLSGDYTLDGATWSGAGTGQVSTATTTLTNNVSVIVSNFLHSGGTIGGSGNLLGTGLFKWTGGVESGTGTNLLTGPLAMAGTVTLSARRLEPTLSTTLSGGSLHMGTGAVFTNDPGVTFAFLDDSSVFNDGGSPVFLNMGTIDKTGAGNGVSGAGVAVSRIETPLYNHSTVRASTGTVEIHGGGLTGSSLDAAAGARILVDSDYTLDGATWSGAGTGQVGSATTTLTNNVSLAVSNFVHSGGTISGPGNLLGKGQFTWTGGTESGSGTNLLTGPLTIAGTVTLVRRLEPMLSTTLSGGSLHMATGAVFTNDPAVTFTFLDDSSIFNDGGAPPAFLNMGTIDKTGAGNGISGAGVGVSRIDAPLYNHSTVRASSGTVEIHGGGITGSSLDVGAGARILLSSDYTLDSATWSGAGTGQVITATTTLTNNVSVTVSNFLHSGGTISGPGNLLGNGLFNWTGGTESGTGTNLLTGPLTIAGTVTLTTRRVEPMLSTTLSGGSLHMGTGAVFTNDPGVAFTFLDDSSVFNDGGSPVFLNMGTIDKTGAGNGISGAGVGVSRIDAPLYNHSTVRASTGTVEIHGGGLTGSGLDAAAAARVLITGDYTLNAATWSGAGTGQVSAATTTLSNTVSVTVSNFLHSGGTIGGPGNLLGTGLFSWTAGIESGSGTNLLSGPLNIAGTVSLSARRLVPVLTASLSGGSLHMGAGAVLENSATSFFNIVDDSSFFNDGLSPAIVNSGMLAKSGSGNGISGAGVGISRVDVPFTNNGTVSAQSGTMSFTAGYVQTAGSTVVTGGVISASLPMQILGGSVVGTGTIVASITNNGTISPGFSPGNLKVSNITNGPGAIFSVELGGTVQGTNYDVLVVTSSAVLGGMLKVSFVNGFQSTVAPGDTFIVLTAGGSLTGAFSNVASGARLTTADGFGSFLVTYASTNVVILNGFTPAVGLAADFSATPINGQAPLSVTFSNITTGLASSYSWDFGDGTGSATTNPIHTYTNGGIYTVTLTAISSTATNSITKTNLISITAPCAPPGTFVDDFTSGLRPAYWSVTQTTAGLFSVDDTHGDVRLAKTGMASPGGVQNVAVNLNMAEVGGSVAGDFSTQISFRNAVIPGPGVDQIELHAHFADGSIFFLVFDNSSGTNVHVWNGSINGQIAVATNAGTFTITRTNSTLTGFFNGSLIFSENNASTLTAVEFVLQLQPGSNDPISVAFDDFSLSAPSVPSQAPAISCSTNMVLSATPGLCSRTNVTYEVNFTDNCSSPVLKQTAGLPSGSTFPVGTTTNTFTLTDASSNMVRCSFTVTVIDTEPPSLACSTNIVRSTNPGLCTASNVTYVATVSDNCPAAILACFPASGSTFTKGVTIVTCTATDATGNTNQCAFSVTVIDTQAPSITCSTNIVRSTDPGLCTASNVTYVTTGSDNCPAAIFACVPASGSTFTKGVTIVTCTATDAAGNTNQCAFSVTVIDMQPPAITCSSNIVVNAPAGAASAAVAYLAPVSSDNCPNVTNSCAPASGSVFPLGMTLVTCVATDASGNTNSCAFTVTVNSTTNNIAPTITCPGDITTNNAPGICARMLSFAPGATGSPTPLVTCKIGTNIVSSPHLFPVGTNLVACTASNIAGSAVCAFNVKVIDIDPPTLTCSTNLTIAAPLGELGTVVGFAVSAIDTCDGAVPVDCIPKSGSYFAVGLTPVTCTATDRSGNRGACNFNVTVIPTIDDLRACSLTQGFYGNANGRFNGLTSFNLVLHLLSQGPLVVGKLGARSLTILVADVALLQQRLPSGGPPATLPANGDQTLQTASLPLKAKGRFNNILLGQAITLSLNVRLNGALGSLQITTNFCSEADLAGPDGLKGTADDVLVTNDTQSFTIPVSVVVALSDPAIGINDSSVIGLLKLANNALAGVLPPGTPSLGDITSALDAFNRGFDQCRALVNCLINGYVPDAFNNAFTNRALLDPPPPPDPLLNVRVSSSNLTATKDAGEPDIAGNPGGKSVWWRWPAPISGPVTISTIGSSFDTLLGVYTGTNLANLVLLASNDDAERTLQSDVTFEAVVGTEYQIAVDGFDGDSGGIVLTLVAVPTQLCQPLIINGNQVQLCLTGELGRTYNIEASSDLSNWTLLATAVNTNGTLSFIDRAMSNFSQRYYRVFFEP
jgi:PKD repeat protein